MEHSKKRTRLSLLSAAALAVFGTFSAAGQDLGVIAELPGAMADYPHSVFVLSLVEGGPPFLVNVTPTSIRAWPVGRVGEPVISPLPEDAYAYGAPAFADFDGDGILDVAIIGTNGIDFLKGDGTGRFAAAAVLPTGTQPYVLAAGDFNGDGRVDVVAYLAPPAGAPLPTPDLLSTYLSEGGFRFDAPRTTAVTPCCGVSTITAGDLDGDGRADLVVSSVQGSVSIWLSAGDGTFTLSQTLGAYNPDTVIIQDLDGDGLPEVVFRESYSFPPFPIRVYKNDGGGRFHLLGFVDTSAYAGSPFLVDMAGEGGPEIAFTEQQYSSTPTLVTFKVVAGALTQSTQPFPRTLLAVVAAVDWNGDGRAEFVGEGTDRLQIFGRSGGRTDVVVVPVLVSTAGLFGSHFDSDLLLTNSGTTPVHATLRYTAAAGGGSGTIERDLAPGRQLFAASAVGYLRDAGLPIASGGNVVGTLRIAVTGASTPRAFSASVRTTTPAGAGVSYAGSPLVSLLRDPSVVPWLVQTARDRTNLALVNAGSDADGPVTLRVEVHAGDLSSDPVVLPDVVLSPGAFWQVGRVLAAAGLTASTGWARITRVTGDAPYLAWASVNDAGSSDGSFVAAVPEGPSPYGSWVVPSVAQTARYATEFVATNPSTDPVTLEITLVTTGTVLEETLAPGATLYLPDLFAELRQRGYPGPPAADAQVVSPLFVSPTGWPRQLYAGARISNSPSAGRYYGVFEPALPQDPLLAFSTVVPDLRQDERTRTNLGLVNLYGGPQAFHIEITDGETGVLVASMDVQLAGYELRQLNAVLRVMAPATTRAWARVTAIPQDARYPSPIGPFAAYAVVNDGPAPGQGTDDGSFIPGVPE